MGKPKSIKLIIFDFDGTLVNLDVDYESTRIKLTDYFNKLGVDFYIRPIYPKILSALTELKKTHSLQQIDDIKKTAFSLMDEEEEESVVEEIEGATEILIKLRRKGIKVAIISLNGEKVIRKIIKKLGFPDIDIIVGRDTTDFIKPDPKVGEYVLNKLKVKPNEVVLVGDTDYDIDLANKLKVKSVWFKNKFNINNSKPDATISKLKEVLEFV